MSLFFKYLKLNLYRLLLFSKIKCQITRLKKFHDTDISLHIQIYEWFVSSVFSVDDFKNTSTCIHVMFQDRFIDF